jgi:hypothetical protein
VLKDNGELRCLFVGRFLFRREVAVCLGRSVSLLGTTGISFEMRERRKVWNATYFV